MAVKTSIETTLLIVESPIIAKVIQQFQITGLICLPTNGYAWLPVYDLKSNGLSVKAIPENLTYRNEIRKTAQIVSKIIIATDNDVSGNFIAWSLLNKIKCKGKVQRGYLSAISRDTIISLLASTVPIDSNELKSKLLYYFRLRFFAVNHFKQTFKNFSFHELICLMAYASLRENNFQRVVSIFPLNTASIISETFKTSYKKAFHLLTSLHTTLTDSGRSLISYPRTNTHSYSKQTWDQLTNYGFSYIQNFVPLPEYNRLYTDPGLHESVHADQFHLTPKQARKWLPPESYLTYVYIYESTIKSIQPPIVDSVKVKDDFLLMESLVNTGFVSASSLPVIMDHLVQKKLINEEQKFNHKQFELFMRNIKIPDYEIWQTLNGLIFNEHVSNDMLGQTLNSI